MTEIIPERRIFAIPVSLRLTAHVYVLATDIIAARLTGAAVDVNDLFTFDRSRLRTIDPHRLDIDDVEALPLDLANATPTAKTPNTHPDFVGISRA